MEFVALQGSPKQICWAESIRKKAFADWERLIDGATLALEEMRGEEKETHHKGILKALRGLEAVWGQTSARWWIEARKLSPKQLLILANEFKSTVEEVAR